MVSWVACYKDGSTIPQGKQGGYDKLNRNNLDAFVLLFEKKPVLTIWLDKGRELIWRLRREIIQGQGEIRVHIVGWRENVKGKTVQSICYVYERYNAKTTKEIFPNIHIAGQYDRNRNRFMYEPKLREFEAFKGETYYVPERITMPNGKEMVKSVPKIKK